MSFLLSHVQSSDNKPVAGAHLRRQDLPVLGEQLLDLGAIHLVAQIAQIQLLSHRDAPCAWLIAAPYIKGMPLRRLPGPDRKRLNVPTDAGEVRHRRRKDTARNVFVRPIDDPAT
jgi:hypothetical protein